MLELAYTLYMDGLCACGWPSIVCQDPENNGWFELPEQSTLCEVQAVLDREQQERQANPNFQPEPGELLRVVLTRDDT